MSNKLSSKEIIEQSWTAFNQWAEQWRDHAVIHNKRNTGITFDKFTNVGVGKALLIVGNGYSFEENIEIIKEHKDNIDIMACDKTIGHLLDNGIVPTYCVLCDANVDFDKYLKPYVHQLKDTILFSNVCANPAWTQCDWKEICFFVNQDAINSEKEFSELSGVSNMIPAATNVSNCMVVIATQSSNKGRNNFFGYDKLVLIGFDYSWRSGDKYYSFNDSGDGKFSYMKHAYLLDRSGETVYSSTNLIFSAKWLDDYIKNFQLPVVVGSKRTLLNSVPCKELSSQLKYNFRKEDSVTVNGLLNIKKNLYNQLMDIENKLHNIGASHWKSFQESI